jgi:hypothetical protein
MQRFGFGTVGWGTKTRTTDLRVMGFVEKPTNSTTLLRPHPEGLSADASRGNLEAGIRRRALAEALTSLNEQSSAFATSIGAASKVISTRAPCFSTKLLSTAVLGAEVAEERTPQMQAKLNAQIVETFLDRLARRECSFLPTREGQDGKC